MPNTKPTRILIAGKMVADLAARIAEVRPDLELRLRALDAVTAADLDWAEVFVGFRKPPVPGWGSVRWIHSIGAGVDGLILRESPPAGVLLTKSGEDFGPAIGEWCLARALAVNQFLADLDLDQRERRWNREREPHLLRGQRAVILGTGQVGRGIGRAFRSLGCRVSGLSRSGAATPDFGDVSTADRFADVVVGADWLILAAPLTPATAGFLSRARLAQCGGTYLMNVGRGALVDEAAIPWAIDHGHLSGAALDVFTTEPLPSDSPLWVHPKITISPHISGPSTLAATLAGFLETLGQVDRGETPRLAVDPAQGY
ncbi:MAG: D-2-hydroxyacid dehydrogenase [Gemmatimonadales bacterium]